MFSSKAFFTSTAILAGEFANFANSKHTPLGEETLTAGYNVYLSTFSDRGNSCEVKIVFTSALFITHISMMRYAVVFWALSRDL